MSAEQEFTTSEAAATLDMSWPSLMKLIHARRIEFRKVGKHHRIPASAIQAFRDRQREERAAAFTAIAELSNRVGQLQPLGEPNWPLRSSGAGRGGTSTSSNPWARSRTIRT